MLTQAIHCVQLINDEKRLPKERLSLSLRKRMKHHHTRNPTDASENLLPPRKEGGRDFQDTKERERETMTNNIP
jgi:hypothetical protein